MSTPAKTRRIIGMRTCAAVIAMVVLAASCGSADEGPGAAVDQSVPTDASEDNPPEFTDQPGFAVLGDFVVDIDGARVPLAESGIRYVQYTAALFDDRDTPGPDGIAAPTREFLACELDTPRREGLPADVWSIGQQHLAVDVITSGVDQGDPETLDAGVAALDWGAALEVNDEAVYLLDRECDDEIHPDYGGTHHTTQWIETLGRSVYLLRESDDAARYADNIAHYIAHMEATVALLSRPDNRQYWIDHWLYDNEGRIYAHRAFMMAAALALTASLTDDPVAAARWSDLADETAQIGIDAQHPDGVNPEIGGYDVHYQMYGTWLAEVYFSLLTPQSPMHRPMGDAIDRAIGWMADHIDSETGEIPLGESTRTCKGETKRIDPATTARVFLLWASFDPVGRADLTDLAVRVAGREPTLCADVVDQ